MKRTLTLMLAMVMIFSLFAACAPAEEGTDTPPVEGGTDTPNSGDSTVPDAEGVTYKEDIIVGISGHITTIDPQEQSNTHHNYFYRMTFDTPLDFNNETLELEPNIVTEWSTEDAITYNFKLRDDVLFHNGEKLTANDVKFSYTRGLDTGSSITLCKLMEEVNVISDYEFEIKLFSANVDFPYMLTLPTASIISEAAVTADPVEGVGIGSGPWMLDSYEFGDYLTMKRNDNFWGEQTETQTVTLRYMPEASSRLIALETGEIDASQDPTALDLSHIRNNENLELQQYVGTSINYFAFNTKAAPFDDQNLRLAIAYAINIPEIIDVIKMGEATQCLSLWGWNQFGYNGGVTPYEHDATKAAEYLAEAGYSVDNPFTFEVSINAGERKSIAELIQAQLKPLGINMELNEMDSAALSSTTTAGEHEGMIYGCGMNVFGDDSRRLIVPGTGVNKSHYDNERVNELMDLAVAELDEAKRLEYYEEVQQITFETAAYVPMFFANGFYGVAKGVNGIDYYPTSHHDMSNIYRIMD